ncbi:MAG TPA: hypothetical protein VED22_02030 [Nitrososphaerales archaeon]|nr:hypothetical protein [Nitrososphaerales archaeon]
MRYLDLAVAALIGTSAIAGLAAFSPRQADVASGGLAMESQLRDELLAILQRDGVAWLIRSSPQVVCVMLRGQSNSSVTFSGVIGPYRCGPSPPSSSSAASLAFYLMPYQVVLEAWPNTPA